MKFDYSEHCYYVYLMTNRPRGVFYVGVTSDLIGRTWKHRSHAIKKSFTDKFNLERLVWYEPHREVTSPIRREKQIKRWVREWKINLVECANPNWEDLWREITSNRPYVTNDYANFGFQSE
ncbi:MAG: GIY-YIG nuclease family protein [Pseudomonadota bacterium]